MGGGDGVVGGYPWLIPTAGCAQCTPHPPPTPPRCTAFPPPYGNGGNRASSAVPPPTHTHPNGRPWRVGDGGGGGTPRAALPGAAVSPPPIRRGGGGVPTTLHPCVAMAMRWRSLFAIQHTECLHCKTPPRPFGVWGGGIKMTPPPPPPQPLPPPRSPSLTPSPTPQGHPPMLCPQSHPPHDIGVPQGTPWGGGGWLSAPHLPPPSPHTSTPVPPAPPPHFLLL